MTALEFEIHIAGVLPDLVAAQLGESRSTVHPAGTVLTGTVADQAAIHGLINRLHGAGLGLIDVRTHVVHGSDLAAITHDAGTERADATL